MSVKRGGRASGRDRGLSFLKNALGLGFRVDTNPNPNPNPRTAFFLKKIDPHLGPDPGSGPGPDKDPDFSFYRLSKKSFVG